jgi:DNA-binding transcriptional LysR family regulator
MDLRHLEAFVAVATLRSFRAAASRLHLTQPAVSSRISALETELGERLFVRDVRPVVLTDRAKQILPYSEQMLELSQQVKPSISSTSNRAVERLRIGANSSLVSAWLSQLSWAVRKAIPDVTLEFEVGASHRLRDRMMSGALDVCFMHAPNDIPGARRQHLCIMDQIWAARPEVVPSRIISASDLANHLLVTFGPEADGYPRIESALRAVDLWPIAHHSTNYADVIVNSMKKIPCIGTVLRACIERELESGELVELRCDIPLPSYHISVCYSLTQRSMLSRRCADVAMKFCETHAEGKGGE